MLSDFRRFPLKHRTGKAPANPCRIYLHLSYSKGFKRYKFKDVLYRPRHGYLWLMTIVFFCGVCHAETENFYELQGSPPCFRDLRQLWLCEWRWSWRNVNIQSPQGATQEILKSVGKFTWNKRDQVWWIPTLKKENNVIFPTSFGWVWYAWLKPCYI